VTDAESDYGEHGYGYLWWQALRQDIDEGFRDQPIDADYNIWENSTKGGASKVSSVGNEIRYRLNDQDEIVFVNEAWDAFASANSGEHLTATHVLGRRLWEFIADVTTRLLYRDILARVRGDRPVRFVFRCDSPDCRRLLETEISRGQDGLAEFRVWALSEDKRQPQPLLDPDRPRSEEILQVCGWCKKVDVCGRWVEVEEAVSLLGLFERPLLPNVTHGICEVCNSQLIAALNDTRRVIRPEDDSVD
jgi:hypothetical protein